jgi:hypothetical protein
VVARAAAPVGARRDTLGGGGAPCGEEKVLAHTHACLQASRRVLQTHPLELI